MEVKVGEDTIILAEARLSAYFEDAEIIARYKGTDLVGMEYEPLFPWVNPGEGAFRVIPGDYVTTEDGTGIVHIAPTFGADDKKVGDAAGVPGLYMQTKNYGPRPMVDFTGKYWKIEDLDPEWVKANVNTELYGKEGGNAGIGGAFALGVGYTYFFRPYIGFQTGLTFTRLASTASLNQPIEWRTNADGSPLTDYMGEEYIFGRYQRRNY